MNPPDAEAVNLSPELARIQERAARLGVALSPDAALRLARASRQGTVYDLDLVAAAIMTEDTPPPVEPAGPNRHERRRAAKLERRRSHAK